MRPRGAQPELEKRRLQIVDMLERGIPPSEMADYLGVSTRSVRHWCALVRLAGADALKAKPTAGRPRKLSAAAEADLKHALIAGATAAGFATNHWTATKIAHFISDRFGVHYHVDHVGRLLRGFGLSLHTLNARLDAVRPLPQAASFPASRSLAHRITPTKSPSKPALPRPFWPQAVPPQSSPPRLAT